MSIESGGRQLLFHGLFMIITGLVWGAFVPATPFPRLALTAHIQFEVNGLLFLAVATLLLALRPDAGPRTLQALLLAAWLSWSMALSAVANAWWGTKEILPLAAQQAGATGGAPWQEQILTLTHVLGAVALIAAWALLIAAFVRSGVKESAA